MKKFMIFLCVLCASLSPLWCTSSLSLSEREELTEIIAELKDLSSEQEQIIERSQKRNEELESLYREQEKTISELESSSQTKQKIIDEQQQTITELESLSQEQKQSSVKELINRALTVVVSFCLGCLLGLLL